MGQNNKGFSETGLRKMRNVLAQHVDSGKIPGLVALVSRNGETHVEALGTMRHDGGAPMRRDTIFRLASTSKPIAVSPVMVLLDECKLHLDDPVDKWLPELADRQVLKQPDGPLEETVPARRPITVRDLLTSTFGLGVDLTLMGSPIMNAFFESGIFDTPGQDMPDPDEFMCRLGALPLSYQPGERWQYHISIEVLGILVARVTGQTFESFLRERIFDPLGMKDTGFYVPELKIERLPPAFNPDPQTGEFIVWDEGTGGRYSKPPAFQAGGGGLLATIDDYHAYLQMLLNKGMHGTKRILSRPAVQLMTTNRLTPEQQVYRETIWPKTTSICRLDKGYKVAGALGWGCVPILETTRLSVNSAGMAELALQLTLIQTNSLLEFCSPRLGCQLRPHRILSKTSGPRSTKQSKTETELRYCLKENSKTNYTHDGHHQHHG